MTKQGTSRTKHSTAGKKAPHTPQRSGTMITAINLPTDVLELLRVVAIRRSARAGKGRPSVSAVICDLVNLHREELESDGL